MKWDSQLYDNEHRFVSGYGEDVVKLLNPQAGETILDVGSGTGDLAAVIAESGAVVHGIDASESMVEQAKAKFPGIHFQVASITDFDKPRYYDAVFSNATLHWIADKNNAVEKMYQNLKPGGRLVLEMGAKGNVAEIIEAVMVALNEHKIPDDSLKNRWYFPSLGEYASLLESKGFRVEYAVHFDRETPLKSKDGIKNWIRMFGKDVFEGAGEKMVDRMLNQIQDSLAPTRFYDGQWYADYKRLRMVATKS